MRMLWVLVLAAQLVMAAPAFAQFRDPADLRPEIPAGREALNARIDAVQAAIAADQPRTSSWALKQIEYGYLLRGRANLDSGVIGRVDDARIAGFNAAQSALRGLDRNRDPIAWAHAQALRAFFADDYGPFRNVDDVSAIDLQVFTKQQHPLQYLEVSCARAVKRLANAMLEFDQITSSPLLALAPICGGLVFGDGQSLSGGQLNRVLRQFSFSLAAMQSEMNPVLFQMMLAADDTGSARRMFQSSGLLQTMTGARAAFLAGAFATDDLGLSAADRQRAGALRAQAEAVLGDGPRAGAAWRANRAYWAVMADLFDVYTRRTPQRAEPLRPPVATIAPVMLDAERGFVAYASARGDGGALPTNKKFAQDLFASAFRGGLESQAIQLDGAMASTATQRWMSFYKDRDFRFGIDLFRSAFEAQWSPAIREAIRRAGAKPGDRVLILPDGAASMLPIGLLRDPETGRTLLEDYEIVVAPSVPVYRKALARAQTSGPASLALIAPPVAETGLPFVAFESAVVKSRFPVGSVSQPASKTETLAALQRSRVWHFATHGAFSPEAPFSSGLQLNGDARLTFADLALSGAPIGAPRLVVLSACETGLFEAARDPDEFIGLPTGFLMAGAGGVVASLWPVSDSSTALLMAKFYALQDNQAVTPPAALRSAQIWLKSADKNAILAFLQAELERGALTTAHLAQVRADLESSPDAIPFADPVFWGAFVYYGA